MHTSNHTNIFRKKTTNVKTAMDVDSCATPTGRQLSPLRDSNCCIEWSSVSDNFDLSCSANSKHSLKGTLFSLLCEARLPSLAIMARFSLSSRLASLTRCSLLHSPIAADSARHRSTLCLPDLSAKLLNFLNPEGQTLHHHHEKCDKVNVQETYVENQAEAGNNGCLKPTGLLENSVRCSKLGVLLEACWSLEDSEGAAGGCKGYGWVVRLS